MDTNQRQLPIHQFTIVKKGIGIKKGFPKSPFNMFSNNATCLTLLSHQLVLPDIPLSGIYLGGQVRIVAYLKAGATCWIAQ